MTTVVVISVADGVEPPLGAGMAGSLACTGGDCNVAVSVSVAGRSSVCVETMVNDVCKLVESSSVVDTTVVEVTVLLLDDSTPAAGRA